MKPAPTIRAAAVLLYITGFGSMLLTGPSMAYNLITGNSVSQPLMGSPPTRRGVFDVVNSQSGA